MVLTLPSATAFAEPAGEALPPIEVSASEGDEDGEPPVADEDLSA
jgi:hypothetical protein